MDWTLETITKIVSTLVVIGLAIGLAYRRQTKKHMTIMSICLSVDIISVLVIELNRHAIGQIPEAEGILAFHIWVSALTVAGYVVALVTGIRLYRTGRGRRVHKFNAGVFIVMRLLNYVTSFLI